LPTKINSMSRFEIFMRDLQVRLNSRLNPDYRRLWVQGNNKNGISIVLTIFNKSGYDMEFIKDKNISLDIESEMYLKYVDGIVNRYNSYFRPE